MMDSFIPKVRCYDNEWENYDRYTIVFGQLPGVPGCTYVGCNANPTHPTYGVYQHGWNATQIDSPRSAHLGKRIHFHRLPAEVQKLIWQEWVDIWNLPAVQPDAWIDLSAKITEGLL